MAENDSTPRLPKSVVDDTGKRFNRLLVISFFGFRNHHANWNCLCDCGKFVVASHDHLRSGHTKSCGCLQTETRQARHEAALIRPGTKLYLRRQRTPEYNAWRDMKRRCLEPKHKSYKGYGARGIKVCDQWLHSFDQFLSDMGPRPSPDLSLDRINNNGNYEPGNCRWATSSQQAKNRRPPSPKTTRSVCS